MDKMPVFIETDYGGFRLTREEARAWVDIRELLNISDLTLFRLMVYNGLASTWGALKVGDGKHGRKACELALRVIEDFENEE